MAYMHAQAPVARVLSFRRDALREICLAYVVGGGRRIRSCACSPGIRMPLFGWGGALAGRYRPSFTIAADRLGLPPEPVVYHLERLFLVLLIKEEYGIAEGGAGLGRGMLLGAEVFGPAAEPLGHLLACAARQRMTVSEVLEMPFHHLVIGAGSLRFARSDRFFHSPPWNPPRLKPVVRHPDSGSTPKPAI
ncbi:hypothetical protein [Chromobacterium vaccinii]|uniref:hypothetical protein n=1 Tax=Chromobacterium vaccinii TaxID=1108595 RepID=UPI001910A494|nr:hypothetical protein [Chromobacterium vaccinii]